MAKSSSSEDKYYEKQILETNKLGNALLSEILNEKIEDNKRKLFSRIQIKEEIKSYKAEIEKLRSLMIGSVHYILNVKEENDPTIQIGSAEKLLEKIENILKENVSYDATEIVSFDEFQELKNNLNVLQSIKGSLDDVPNTAEEKLDKVKKFSESIELLLNKIESLEIIVKKNQDNLIKHLSESIDYM